jgi:hypothetical protein
MGVVDAAVTSMSALRAVLGAALGKDREKEWAHHSETHWGQLLETRGYFDGTLKEVPMAFQTETQMVH